tara:strand:- start:25 stop:1425 length:1401 start_codon:yes stop_codon:yes gene_type:complete
MPSSVAADSVSHVANSTTTPYQPEFRKLSFYLARNEVAQFPKWNTYDTLFGSIKWQPNMGNTLNGLTAMPSPVERITFAPNTLDAFPAKDQFKIGERYETAKLGAHRFESHRFRFLSNFEAFWRDQLQYAHKDIVRQIALANNIFVRTLMYYQTPDLFVCNQGLSSQLTLPGSVDKRAFSSDDVRLVDNGADNVTTAIDVGGGATVANSGGIEYRDEFCHGAANVAGPLTLEDIYKAMLHLQEDVQAPTFERQQNAPKTSEMIKGKYVLICSTEAWSSLLWDADLKAGGDGNKRLAPANMNLINDGFAGDLWGKVTAKFDPFPLRFTDNGTFVAPQSVDGTSGKVIPNTNYTTISATSSDTVASSEVAFLVGADAFKTIAVGPPPKEFASKNMSAKKFYSMKWNGEVTLTDQFLIPNSGTALSDTGTQDLNVYGDYLKFISQAVFGGIPGDSRHCLPIFYRRRRTS